MPLRTCIAGDHEDYRALDEVSRCRVGLIIGTQGLAERTALLARLDPAHPARQQHEMAANNYRRIIDHNAARLRELTQEMADA